MYLFVIFYFILNLMNNNYNCDAQTYISIYESPLDLNSGGVHFTPQPAPAVVLRRKKSHNPCCCTNELWPRRHSATSRISFCHYVIITHRATAATQPFVQRPFVRRRGVSCQRKSCGRRTPRAIFFFFFYSGRVS